MKRLLLALYLLGAAAPTAWTQICQGTPAFTAKTAISTTANFATSVYAADIDGDGDVDVLSASQFDDKIAWYKNDGAGNFTAQPAISTTADGAFSVYAADIDGDGDMDVLSASTSDDKIAWYKNDGAGNFTAQPAISTTADGAFSVYAADIDGDGDLDVLSASTSDNKIAWYKNDGAGNFTTQPAISTTADGAFSVYAADIDGDGDVDVLSASAGDDKIAWYENTCMHCASTTTFPAQPAISTAADAATSVYAADIDGDGDLDVLSASAGDDKIAWYQNDGASNFTAQTAISTTADGARSVYAADIDGDGDLDVLSASANDDKIAWYQNDGAGNFTAQTAISTAANFAVSVYAADVDGDGDLDVLSASFIDDKIAWYKNDGAGNFTAQPTISTTANGAQSVYAADIDGDGDVDVLSASRNDDKIAWYKNDGAGNFTAQPTISTTANGAQSVYAADIDGDGDVDVLSASQNDSKIAWYKNDGAGNFTAQTAISITANSAQSVYAADIDGDGDVDVLSASANDDKIAWYENTCVTCVAELSGDATICSGEVANLIVTITDGTGPYTVEIDNNGDMTADITVPNYTGGSNIPVMPGATTTYTLLSVIDNAGGDNVMCEVSGTATVTVNPLPTGTFTISDTEICEGEAPFLQFQATVGTPNFTITFGGGNINPGTTTQTAGNGNPFWTLNTDWYNEGLNTYTITQIEDANGCIATVNIELTLTVSPLPTGTFSISDDEICEGEAPFLQFEASTGTGPYIITFGGGNINPGTTTQTAGNGNPFWTLNTDWYNEGLNTYTITQIEDANGCITTLNEQLTLTVNPLPTGTIAGDIACANEDAFLTFTATVGTAPFFVIIDGLNGNNEIMAGAGNGNPIWTFTPGSLAVGDHTFDLLSIRDANGCVFTGNPINSATITIQELPAGTISSNFSAICAGESIELTFTATVGVGPFDIVVNGIPYNDVLSGSVFATLSPNSNTNYTLTQITDNNGCIAANLSQAISVTVTNCQVTVLDPCTCKNNATTLINGQFNETIQVMNAPTGQTWTVTAVTGLYNSNSAAPPAAPMPIPVGTVLTESPAGSGTYILPGVHVDALGYTISVSNGRGITFSLANACVYPNPAITLDPVYCKDEPAVLLTGTPGDANILSQSFKIDGTTATLLDPAALTVGNHTIEYTVDGGKAKEFGPNDPGCIQTVSQQVRIDPQVTVDAGSTQTICKTKTLSLAGLDLTVTYTGGNLADLQYSWSIVEVGNNGTLTGTSTTDPKVGTYTPGADAIARGYVTLRLTVDNPNDACDAVSDTLRVNIQNVDCGQFPWNGN